MKSKLFIVIVIIAVIIGIYFAVKKSPAQPAQTQSENNSSLESLPNNMEEMDPGEMGNMDEMPSVETISKTVVNYTDSGFNPASIEIKKGDTVQFVNKSSGGMWVASGPHPTHTIYPEFDAKKTIPSGGSYEFTFTKVGEWKYHNHSKASAFGTVIVK